MKLADLQPRIVRPLGEWALDEYQPAKGRHYPNETPEQRKVRKAAYNAARYQLRKQDYRDKYTKAQARRKREATMGGENERRAA